MKKYFWLYLGSLLLVSLPSWSMDYDQDEGEYDQNGDEGTLIQNDMMMQQQPNMMYQNNMIMNQGMLPNAMQMQNGMLQDGMMMQQPGMMSTDGMMYDQMNTSGEELNDETSKREYVQSLVNDILQIRNEQQNQASLRKTKNGGTVLDRSLKNKLFKLQKDLDEIDPNSDAISPELRKNLDEIIRGLSGISLSEESTTKKSKSSDSSARGKSSDKTKSTSKKSKSAKSKGYSKNSKKSKSTKSKTHGKMQNRKMRVLKLNGAKGFHTVKPLNYKNAKKFIPKYRFSRGYPLGNGEVKKYRSTIPSKKTSYKIKIYGTGKTIPAEVYYQKNPSYSSEKSNSQKGSSNSLNKPNSQQNSTYFSDKSNCDNGCGTR